MNPSSNSCARLAFVAPTKIGPLCASSAARRSPLTHTVIKTNTGSAQYAMVVELRRRSTSVRIWAQVAARVGAQGVVGGAFQSSVGAGWARGAFEARAVAAGGGPKPPHARLR